MESRISRSIGTNSDEVQEVLESFSANENTNNESNNHTETKSTQTTDINFTKNKSPISARSGRKVVTKFNSKQDISSGTKQKTLKVKNSQLLPLKSDASDADDEASTSSCQSEGFISNLQEKVLGDSYRDNIRQTASSDIWTSTEKIIIKRNYIPRRYNKGSTCKHTTSTEDFSDNELSSDA